MSSCSILVYIGFFLLCCLHYVILAFHYHKLQGIFAAGCLIVLFYNIVKMIEMDSENE